MNDIQFFLALDDDEEQFPFSSNLTIGRHLDNDLVIAGEDVRDFHARLDVTPRGPMVWPLDGAHMMMDDAEVDTPTGIMPGDCLILGQHQLTLGSEDGEGSVQWALHPAGDGSGQPLADEVLIGRGEDCQLQILEGHISRKHARLFVIGDTVWLKDLGSSNGSYVNGERITGAARIYHGDELTFDISRYQLIGDHPDLTPIRELTASSEVFELATELDEESVETADVRPLIPASAPLAEVELEGPELRGVDGNIAGRSFPLRFGRQLVGRAPDVDIHLPEPSVSLRHAEIDVRSDGVIVTNLISTNGIQVNGMDVHIQRIEPGDRLQLGRATLEFRSPRPSEPDGNAGTSARTIGIAATVAVVAGLLLWWGFG